MEESGRLHQSPLFPILPLLLSPHFLFHSRDWEAEKLAHRWARAQHATPNARRVVQPQLIDSYSQEL